MSTKVIKKRLVDQRAGNNEFVARKQHDHDNYETPACAVESLVTRIFKRWFSGTILEPCCGPGALVRELQRLLPAATIIGSDIRTGEQIYGTKGIDFLNYDAYENKSVDWVITNPPFTDAEAVTLRALEIAREGVCIINRTNWVESLRRYYNLWEPTPIKDIMTFVRRLDFYPEGEVTTEIGGMICFAWFVWNHSHDPKIPPSFHWILDKPHMKHDTRLIVPFEDSHKPTTAQGKLFQ